MHNTRDAPYNINHLDFTILLLMYVAVLSFILGKSKPKKNYIWEEL